MAIEEKGNWGAAKRFRLIIREQGQTREMGGNEMSLAVGIVDNIMMNALDTKSSDIHLQPLQGTGLIRLRVDGVLVNFATVPIGVLDRSIGRIKAVSGMDPANRRVPQDGRCSARIADRAWDLRIAILPVDGGERMVIRLLGGLSVSGLPSIGLRDIANTREHADARLTKLGLGAPQRVFTACADRHVDAFTGETPRDGSADALARGGNDRVLSLELKIHLCWLVVSG